MDTLFIDYENSLIGRDKTIAAYNFYGAESGGANEKRALSCIRFAIEKILQWDEEDAVKNFDRYIIRVMKLERVLDFIKWPIEVQHGDPRYILHCLYPERVNINESHMIVDIYKNVLKGELQFPREYFGGANGLKRFCVCLSYIIKNYKPFDEVEELYKFFSSMKGRSFLSDKRLKVPADQLGINILDCVYLITSDYPDSELYYRYYQFKNQYEKELH